VRAHTAFAQERRTGDEHRGNDHVLELEEVSFGRKVPPFDPAVLSQKGSLYLTRPTLATYTAKRSDLEAASKELFDRVLSGKVKIEIGQRYVLKDAAQAQRDLEARKTTGSSILIP
jgi:NADPH2:quinone reductase